MFTFEKVRSDAIIPVLGTRDSSGFDLHFCPEDGKPARVWSDSISRLKTGVRVVFGESQGPYYGQVWGRSGNTSKGLICPRVGIIDSDYRGEIEVMLFSLSGWKDINPGDRIAQIVFVMDPTKIGHNTYVRSRALRSERGEGGFGSTGT